MALSSKIESVLFIAAKPLTVKKLAEFTEMEEKEISEALNVLKEKYNHQENGIQLMNNGKEWQMITNPDNSKLVKQYVQDENTGELTRPSLEALTIVAYRGPITKLELEQIRGVNCSLILRNLMIRGLIQTEEDKARVQLVYTVTLDFMRFLGLRELSELPDYEHLHHNDLLQRLLEDTKKSEV
ncbi:MAG: SMC-Scp complex subunit ScpB [Patescibacteria group bacterium]